MEDEPACSATAQELELARRFLPRVFVTREEPFNLKDLVVVLRLGDSLQVVNRKIGEKKAEICMLLSLSCS